VIHASVDGDTIVVTTAQLPERQTTARSTSCRPAWIPKYSGASTARISEYQQDQGDSPLVQQELHAQDEAKVTSPDSVRIMLTGNADLETAMQAVNEGSIFVF